MLKFDFQNHDQMKTDANDRSGEHFLFIGLKFRTVLSGAEVKPDCRREKQQAI